MRYYDTADPETRGRDSTVGLPSPEEIRLAKDNVGELAGEGTSYLTVTVSNQRYVIKSPDSRPFIPVGRWTRRI
jgi:hypothetical protein